MQIEFKIRANDLVSIIDKTRFSISDDPSRYYLNGLFLQTIEADGIKLNAVSTDGHKLSVITSTKTKVIRNGKIVTIDNDDIVLDDIILFKSGNQIVTDAIIMEGEVSVNESFITGETELITYKEGDMLKSGSFIVVGNCKAKVEHVSLDNYTNVISKDAKYVKPINSILMNSLNKIIKVISILIIPHSSV